MNDWSDEWNYGEEWYFYNHIVDGNGLKEFEKLESAIKIKEEWKTINGKKKRFNLLN